MGKRHSLLKWSCVYFHVNTGALSGPFLVSRTGDAGWTERWVKVPKSTLMRSQERCWLIQTAGRWPWKSESAKECVTTHLPNQLALKMDGAQALHLSPAAVWSRPVLVTRRVGGRGAVCVYAVQAGAWAQLKPALVQILVVVAIIQMRTLKAEVEKGSTWTAFGRGWVGPKRWAKAWLVRVQMCVVLSTGHAYPGWFPHGDWP